jgi:hypothetical protein
MGYPADVTDKQNANIRLKRKNRCLNRTEQRIFNWKFWAWSPEIQTKQHYSTERILVYSVIERLNKRLFKFYG